MSTLSIITAVGPDTTAAQLEATAAALPSNLHWVVGVYGGMDPVAAFAMGQGRADAVVITSSARPGAARNEALKVALGDWIAPVDPGHRCVEPLALVTAAKKADAKWAAGAYATATAAGKKKSRPQGQPVAQGALEAGDLAQHRTTTGAWGLAPSGSFCVEAELARHLRGFSTRTDSALSLLGIVSARSVGGWVDEPVVLVPAADVSDLDGLDEAVEQRLSELG